MDPSVKRNVISSFVRQTRRQEFHLRLGSNSFRQIFPGWTPGAGFQGLTLSCHFQTWLQSRPWIISRVTPKAFLFSLCCFPAIPRSFLPPRFQTCLFLKGLRVFHDERTPPTSRLKKTVFRCSVILRMNLKDSAFRWRATFLVFSLVCWYSVETVTSFQQRSGGPVYVPGAKKRGRFPATGDRSSDVDFRGAQEKILPPLDFLSRK